ncbi:MAG TPA: sigma-70 family RNA polymerase sigma factor, partial [Pirellulaceae bacterium]
MHIEPDTRTSLIMRLRRPEDERAWLEFWSLYQPVVLQVARRRGLQDADAMDLTQEVMRRVAQAIERWEPGRELGSFRGWLRTITRNLVVQFLRDKGRRPAALSLEQINELANPETPDDETTSRLFEVEHQRQLFAWGAEVVREQCQMATW